jgi:hypothetical protein
MCGLLLFNMYYDGWFCLMCIEFMMGGGTSNLKNLHH